MNDDPQGALFPGRRRYGEPGNAWGGHSVGKSMEVLAFPSRLRQPRSADHQSATVTAAKVLAVAGVAPPEAVTVRVWAPWAKLV